MKRILLPHQIRAIQFALNKDIVRFSMVTGSGKTVTAINLIENHWIDDESIVIAVCHTNNLKKQFEESVILEKKFLKNIKNNWLFYTYQSLVSVKREEIKANKIILLVDESHQGGLEGQDIEKEKSYSKIVKELKPWKTLSLSATDYGLDSELFGTEKDTFYYSYKDAMNDGIINDCEFITIHTGLTQQILNKLDNSTSLINGNNIKDIYTKDLLAQVDLLSEESIKAIRLGHVVSSIEAYFHEIGNGDLEQALFFVENIELAEKTVELFNNAHILRALRLRHKNFSNVVAKVSHSKVVNSEDIIQDFKDGKFPVLINVRQVQEGFDLPSLRLVFDCAFSISNEGRLFKQRNGRLIRKSPDKKVSKYFACCSLVRHEGRFDVSKISSSIDNSVLEQHINILGEAAVSISNHFNENILLDAVDIGINHSNKIDSKLFDLKDLFGVDDFSITTVSSPLIVSKATGFREITKYNLFDLLKKGRNSPNENKNQLLLIDPSEQRPIRGKHPLAAALTKYTMKDGDQYDPVFTEKIKAQKPHWFADSKTVNAQRIKDFYNLYNRLPRDTKKDPEERKLYQLISNYISPNHPSYMIEFREWVLSVGYGVQKRVSDKKQNIKTFFVKNKKLPSPNSEDREERILGMALKRYCTNHGCHDSEMRQWAIERGYKGNGGMKV